MSFLIPLADAQAVVGELARPLDAVTVAAGDALGFVLAEPVVAEGDVPSFANSSMDGFALRAADAAQPLRIVGRLGAGEPADAVAVGAGEAVRIMTGAAIPPGADAVVMVERTTESDGSVTVDGAVVPGDFIRWPGEDVRAGATLLEPGAVLTPLHLGVVASAGYASLRVVRRPVVGVLSTGDELVDPPAPLRLAQIRNSNRPMLAALAARDGATVLDFGNVDDDEAALDDALARACGRCDLVVTSGGVSMGDRDLVKQRLAAVQVAIKPAKPLAYGVLHDTPVVGLPGNPVSSAVSYALFVRPLLRTLLGDTSPSVSHLVRLAAPVAREHDGKTHLVRVTITTGADAVWEAMPVLGQGSHQLAATAGADGFVEIPDGDGMEAGALVPFRSF